jgi:hypothetical protein
MKQPEKLMRVLGLERIDITRYGFHQGLARRLFDAVVPAGHAHQAECLVYYYDPGDVISWRPSDLFRHTAPTGFQTVALGAVPEAEKALVAYLTALALDHVEKLHEQEVEANYREMLRVKLDRLLKSVE